MCPVQPATASAGSLAWRRQGTGPKATARLLAGTVVVVTATVPNKPALGAFLPHDEKAPVAEGKVSKRAPVPLGAILARSVAPIDWSTFWDVDAPGPEWLVEPILPKGRQVTIFSPAKVGKSLLALDLAAASATGRGVLGTPVQERRNVVYLDYEMVEADLRERLTDLGYGPEDDLSGLAYYQLPSLPALDTRAGGEALEEIVTRHQASWVVVDTMARVVEGDENEAGTFSAFFAHSGSRLKRMGVSLLRLDHAGKDPMKGQRGSSSKTDDVDVVFRLGINEATVVLARTHSRLSWVPAEVVLRRETEPVLRHVLAEGGWPGGTKEVAELLDELRVPLDATVRSAQEAIKRHTGKGRRVAVVMAGLKFRRTRSVFPDPAGNTERKFPRETVGTLHYPTTPTQVDGLAVFPGTSGKQSAGGTGKIRVSIETPDFPAPHPSDLDGDVVDDDHPPTDQELDDWSDEYEALRRHEDDPW